MIDVLLAQLFFGLTVPVHKFLLTGVDPFVGSSMRAIGSGIMLVLPTILTKQRNDLSKGLRDYNALLAAVTNTAKYIFRYMAYGSVTVLHLALAQGYIAVIHVLTTWPGLPFVSFGTGASALIMFFSMPLYAGFQVMWSNQYQAQLLLSASMWFSYFNTAFARRALVESRLPLHAACGIYQLIGGIILMAYTLIFHGLSAGCFTGIGMCVFLSAAISACSHLLYAHLLRSYSLSTMVLFDLLGVGLAIIIGLLVR